MAPAVNQKDKVDLIQGMKEAKTDLAIIAGEVIKDKDTDINGDKALKPDAKEAAKKGTDPE